MMKELLEQVKATAREAGEIALKRKIGAADIHEKGAADYVTEVDLAVNAFVTQRLLSLLPGSRVFSEEASGGFQDTEALWILDPIDGTSNLIFDLRLSAVSICLLQNGEPALGVVYNPFSGELFSAVRGGGAFLNETPISVNKVPVLKKSLVGFGTTPYSRENAGEVFAAVRRVFAECVDVRRLGAASLDICSVACGRYAGFFEHTLSPWDFAGASVILLEAGGSLTNFQNEPLSFAVKQGVVASNGLVHAELLALLQPGN